MKELKYLVWIGEKSYGFYSQFEAECEVRFLRRIGYDDVYIEKL